MSIKFKNKLTIISIPYLRLKRILLFPDFIDSISSYSDILIVSSENEKIRSKQNISYFSLNNKISKFSNFFFNLSEFLRFFGFYRRERNNGLMYYYNEMFLDINSDGIVSEKPVYKKILMYFLSIIGSFETSWIFFDKIIGRYIFNEPSLLEITNNYKNISIIQSSNWGFNDRKLAWISKKQNWKKILIPYTTDQLFCNGYLISNFDYVLVQGPNEFNYATDLHKLNPEKIIKFGSLLFRHVDKVVNEIKKVNTEKRILFAGISKQYFPLASQMRVIDLICKNIENDKLSNVKLILRPFLNKYDLNFFKKKYSNKPYIEFELPEISNYGLVQKEEKDFLKEFENYIMNLSKIDLLIMPLITSLALESSYLGIPIISVIDDSTGNLNKRNINILINNNNKIKLLNNLKFVYNIETLIKTINKIFSIKSDKSYKELSKNWDYDKINYKEKLKFLISN